MGVDPKLLASIVNVSTGRSWSTEVYNPCPGVVETAPASKGYAGGFGSALILKVIGMYEHARAHCFFRSCIYCLQKKIHVDDFMRTFIRTRTPAN